MKKIVVGLVIALFVSISFLMACSGGKSAAELAIKTAEQAVNATKAEAAKVVPDQVKSLEDTLASAKEKFVKGEYKVALEEATALAGKAKDVLAAAKAKKEELTQKWTELSQGVPQMIADIQSKVDSLSKLKKLPASLTKEKFEEVKAGLASITCEWSKAQDSFKTGSFVDAVSMATLVKEKAVKAMEALGMSVPAPTTAPAPVPTPTPAPAPATAPAK
jgi:nucleotide-binding universal stress UspA family protein